MKALRVLFLLGLICQAAPSAQAQLGLTPSIGPATDYVAWSASVHPDSLRPGGSGRILLQASIEEPWKMYALESSLPPASEGPRSYGVQVAWEEWPDGLALTGEGIQSDPEVGFDPNFNLTLQWFHARARFAWPFSVDAGAASGPRGIAGSVRFQICNDDVGVCLPPTSMAFEALLLVDPDCLGSSAGNEAACELDEAAFDALLAEYAADETGAAGTSARTLSAADGGIDAARAGGLLGFLILALGAGFASLLTPCVFPMVPLTISYFSKHAEDRSEAVRLAGVFGGAIVVTFTLLGMLMAAIVGAAGAQTIAANPWVNLFIAAVLVGFALSLLGLYELRLPGSVVNYANRQSSERGGYGGVLFMGLTLTLVSFSCTAPFVGGLLAAASGGTWLWPLVGMMAYSAAFAIPFVLLAVFPGALARLPKSGSWMNVLKVVLGFVELAAALKFLSNADLVWRLGLLSRPLAIALTVVIFVVTGLYLFGKLRLPHDEPASTVGVGRMLAAVGFTAFALYMLPGLFGAPLGALDAYLPPRQATDVSLIGVMGTPGSETSDEDWFVDDLDAALVEAASLNRPVLIDFTGYTCTNCREMEANVFPAAPVRERFERDFVLLRLYTDGLEQGPDFQRYQLGLTGTVALPTYAILAPDGETLLGRVSGILDREAFVRFLDTGSARFTRS